MDVLDNLAEYFAMEIVEEIKKAPSGRRGAGAFPKNTGVLQNDSVNVIYGGAREAVIGIGGEKGSNLAWYASYVQFDKLVGRTNKPNPNYMFIENRTFPYLKKQMEGKKYYV